MRVSCRFSLDWIVALNWSTPEVVLSHLCGAQYCTPAFFGTKSWYVWWSIIESLSILYTVCGWSNAQETPYFQIFFTSFCGRKVLGWASNFQWAALAEVADSGSGGWGAPLQLVDDKPGHCIYIALLHIYICIIGEYHNSWSGTRNEIYNAVETIETFFGLQVRWPDSLV